ncbi:MAG TPA: sugar transferase, partial [Bryobacteraceae bacterium]
LVANRQQGNGLERVLLIGGPGTTAHLHRQLSTHPEAGYQPVAAHMPSSASDVIQTGAGTLPVVGHGREIDDVFEAISDSGATAVAITAGATFDPATLRQLGWQLAARNIGMIMAPALTDVAGPRIRTQPVAGLPLIHVTTPKLEGSKRFLKRSFDIVVSTVLLALLAVPMMLVALVVRLDSKGPAIFRQQRIGRAGAAFEMYKFRSMVADAEARLDSLRAYNEGSGLLFKMKQDPRITRIGAIIRRYSIDELPQLFNVLRGEMSLVGPRPPLPSEVVGYDDYAHRRLLVQPGITGLWQVSGRSNLSWEDSLRLDLYYVENWSLTQDLLILVRTVRAVASRRGAY